MIILERVVNNQTSIGTILEAALGTLFESRGGAHMGFFRAHSNTIWNSTGDTGWVLFATREVGFFSVGVDTLQSL